MTSSQLVVEFVEEPVDSFVIKRHPAVLRCAATNARQLVFRCNGKKRKVEVERDDDDLAKITLRITRGELESFFASFPFRCVCEAWSFHGDVIRSEKATVKLAYLKGNFEQEPTGGEALIGHEFKLQCAPPAGLPSPQVYWLKNGRPMSSADKNLYVTRRGDVIIQARDVSDGGNFTCVAHNLVGKRTSHTARVQVTNDAGSSWSAWSSWSNCGNSCGLNEQKRRRSCIPPTNSLLPPSNAAAASSSSSGCHGESVQRKTCLKSCSGEWSAWSACDVKRCQQTRTRNSTSSNSNRQIRSCPKQLCNSNPPPVLGGGAGGKKINGGVGGATSDVMLVYGIVIATLLFILVAALLYFCKRRRNRKYNASVAATASPLMTSSSKARHHRHLLQQQRRAMMMMTSSQPPLVHTADSVLINDKLPDMGKSHRHHHHHHRQQQQQQQQQSSPYRQLSFDHRSAYHPRDAVGSNVTYWKHADDDVSNNFDLAQREALKSENFGCYDAGHDEITQQRF